MPSPQRSDAPELNARAHIWKDATAVLPRTNRLQGLLCSLLSSLPRAAAGWVSCSINICSININFSEAHPGDDALQPQEPSLLNSACKTQPQALTPALTLRDSSTVDSQLTLAQSVLMGKVPTLVSHSCCHELAGATQGPAIRVSLVNEHWSKMRKCEVLLSPSIRERRSSLGTGARPACPQREQPSPTPLMWLLR